MPDTRVSPPAVPDDGRSRWWMIPAAIATVLGVAAGTIIRERLRHAMPGESGERAAIGPSSNEDQSSESSSTAAS